MRYDVDKLDARRLALGWTKRNVALESGLAYTTILSVFAGHSQAPRTIAIIANAMELGLKNLIIE